MNSDTDIADFLWPLLSGGAIGAGGLGTLSVLAQLLARQRPRPNWPLMGLGGVVGSAFTATAAAHRREQRRAREEQLLLDALRNAPEHMPNPYSSDRPQWMPMQ